jgi:hypothetical protein
MVLIIGEPNLQASEVQMRLSREPEIRWVKLIEAKRKSENGWSTCNRRADPHKSARDRGCPVLSHNRILKRLATIMLLISVAAWPCWGSNLEVARITKRSRRAWIKLLKLPYDECNFAYREETLSPREQNLAGFKFHRLGKNEYLIEVECGFGGNGQLIRTFAYYNEINRKAPVCRVLRLKTYRTFEDQVDSDRDTMPFCDATYDPKKKALELFHQDRMEGDCGTLVVYGFNHGIPFVKEVRARTCSNVVGSPTDPHTWKKIRDRQDKRKGHLPGSAVSKDPRSH